MQYRILVVDDEKVLVKGIKFNLENEGYQVETGYDGEEAVELAREGGFDLIILDVMMPKIDGLQACMRIREFSNGPIIMLTAKGEDTDKIIGFECGADDYLTKPFHSRELLARIRAMTRAQSSQTSSVLQMGNITLDQRTYELSSPTGSFRLANKEFQMCELLMANPHHVIPTERFLEKIWGCDSDAEITVVWVYVSYLRKKLAALHADIQIKAHRNAGYSLEEAP